MTQTFQSVVYQFYCAFFNSHSFSRWFLTRTRRKQFESILNRIFQDYTNHSKDKFTANKSVRRGIFMESGAQENQELTAYNVIVEPLLVDILFILTQTFQSNYLPILLYIFKVNLHNIRNAHFQTFFMYVKRIHKFCSFSMHTVFVISVVLSTNIKMKQNEIAWAAVCSVIRY